MMMNRFILSLGICALLSILRVSAQDAPLRLLYFNDAHDLGLTHTDYIRLGSVSRMKTKVDSIISKDPSALVLYGGDLGGGTLEGMVFRGHAMVEALNMLPVHYANFGQHDFDYGVENTERLVEESRFTWLSANVYKRNGERIRGTLPYVTIARSGRVIGIIGSTDKVSTTNPTSGVEQRDIYDSVRRCIDEMGEVDLLVVLTQMPIADNERLLRRCPEIDIILTEGTSHYRTEVQMMGRSVIIAGCENMGRLEEISWSAGGDYALKSHSVDESVGESPRLKSFVDEKYAGMADSLDVTVGHLDPERVGDKAKTGAIVAEAYRRYYGTNFAMINGGGLRSVLADPVVTKRHIYSVLPYGNKVIPVRLSGEELVALVGRAMSISTDTAVSGLTVVRKSDVKERPEYALIYNGDPIAPIGYYTIALPDFVVNGGGDFDRIPEEKFVRQSKGMLIDSEIVISYISGLH